MQNKQMGWRWGLAFITLGGLSLSLLAQDSESTPSATVAETEQDAGIDPSEEDLEVLDDFDEPLESDAAMPLKPDEDETLLDETLLGETSDVDEAIDGESADGELSDADMQASMERFIPSEKISEDRPVSFPNDI